MPALGRKAAAVLAGALFLATTSASLDGDAAARTGSGRVAAKGGKKPLATKPPSKPKGPAGPRKTPPADAPPARAALSVDLPLATRHLAGGVLVIAIPSSTAQVVAVTVVEGAGASSDPPDRSGLASLRARLDGTRATAERRSLLIAERGGDVSTRVEAEQVVSSYVVPAGELALPLWLESDRLEARVSEETLVGSLRAMAEAREHDPAARHRSGLDSLVYSGFAPYAHDPDGTADELVAIRNDAVAGTLPARPTRPIVVVITGAITADAALEAADRELAGVAARPAAASTLALPDQTNQREAVAPDARAATGTLWVGFAVPPAAEVDHAALEVAAAMLASGPRSRLDRALVDGGLAESAHAQLERRRGPSELRIEVDLAPGADPVRAREITERTLLELGRSPPPPDEVRRAIAWLIAERVRTLSDPSALANEIARMAVREPDAFAGPKGSVHADLDRWNATTGDAVARAVATHLSPIRRNVLEVRPEHPLEAPTGPSFSKAPPRLPGLGRTPGGVAGKPPPGAVTPGAKPAKAPPAKGPRRPAKKRGKP